MNSYSLQFYQVPFITSMAKGGYVFGIIDLSVSEQHLIVMNGL